MKKTSSSTRIERAKQAQAGFRQVTYQERDVERAECRTLARQFARAIVGANADAADYVQAFEGAYNLIRTLRFPNTPQGKAANQRLRQGLPPDTLADSEWAKNARRMIGSRFSIFEGDLTSNFPECVLVGKTSEFCCSGVLIDRKVVLTAAHCTGGFGCAASRIGIGNDQDGGNLRTVNVATVRKHPDFDPETLLNDVAALILEDEVNDISPAEFATTGEIDAATSVRAVGFGFTDADEILGFGRKRETDITIRSRACLGAGHADKFGCHADLELVAQDVNVADTCRGDSGGPIYVNVNGTFLLAGITSRPIKGTTGCGGGGIYPRIDAYTDFIDGVLDDL
jgi:hypothetical protein